MAFSVPVFNLTANIWRPTNPPPAAPAVVSLCNLQFARKRHLINLAPATPQGYLMFMWILFPALTDVRGRSENGGPADIIEVVPGSGRIYLCQWVDDVAKGFANEYRCAVCYAAGGFPVPIP